MHSIVSMSVMLLVAAKFFSSPKYSHPNATTVCACSAHRTRLKYPWLSAISDTVMALKESQIEHHRQRSKNPPCPTETAVPSFCGKQIFSIGHSIGNVIAG